MFLIMHIFPSMVAVSYTHLEISIIFQAAFSYLIPIFAFNNYFMSINDDILLLKLIQSCLLYTSFLGVQHLVPFVSVRLYGSPELAEEFQHHLSTSGTLGASLYTGMSQEHTGRVGYEDLVPWNYTHTLAGELSKAGYYTQCVGKMHVHPLRNNLDVYKRQPQ